MCKARRVAILALAGAWSAAACDAVEETDAPTLRSSQGGTGDASSPGIEGLSAPPARSVPLPKMTRDEYVAAAMAARIASVEDEDWTKTNRSGFRMPAVRDDGFIDLLEWAEENLTREDFAGAPTCSLSGRSPDRGTKCCVDGAVQLFGGVLSAIIVTNDAMIPVVTLGAEVSTLPRLPRRFCGVVVRKVRLSSGEVPMLMGYVQ